MIIDLNYFCWISIGIGHKLVEWFIMRFRTAPAMTAVICFQTLLNSFLCITLAITVNGGIDLIARINCLFTKMLNQLGPYHFPHIRKDVAYGTVNHVEVNRFGNSFLVLGLIDITQLQHATKNPVSPLKRAFWVDHRIIFGRCFWQARNHCHLCCS